MLLALGQSDGRAGAEYQTDLTRLYFEEGLTLTQVAERLGMTEPSVGERLRRSGYRLRPACRQPQIPTGALARLYFDDGLTLAQVAARVGADKRTVRMHLAEAGSASWRSSAARRHR